MMRYELELEAETTQEEFKTQVFANNPKLYNELWKEEDTDFPDEDKITFPESEEEFKAMLASMQREVLNG